MNNPDQNPRLQRLEAAMTSMRRAMVSARERFGSGLQLTRTQLEILQLLITKPAQTTGELARQLSLTQSAVTQTVDTLARRQLVERRSDEHDRRIIRLQLSPQGQQMIDHIRSLKHRHLQEFMSRLSVAEAEALITATEKVTAFIEETQVPISKESPER